jgi:hypothetical protein
MSEQKVESGRIAEAAIIAGKIATGAVQGNSIATAAISGNHLNPNIVRTNNIVAGSVTGNLITDASISGNHLNPNIISTNNIVAGSVTGNLIAASAVGSNTLTPNLSLSLVRVFETANVFTTGATGNVIINVLNNTVYFFSSNTTGNVTFNFRANTQNTLDSQLGLGQSVTSAILLKQGDIRYRANVYVDDVLQTVWWLGNSAPGYATTQQESIDLYSFNILKTAANTYTVLASNSNFSLAQGQIS